jgi:hypothetical protein
MTLQQSEHLCDKSASSINACVCVPWFNYVHGPAGSLCRGRLALDDVARSGRSKLFTCLEPEAPSLRMPSQLTVTRRTTCGRRFRAVSTYLVPGGEPTIA